MSKIDVDVDFEASKFHLFTDEKNNGFTASWKPSRRNKHTSPCIIIILCCFQSLEENNMEINFRQKNTDSISLRV